LNWFCSHKIIILDEADSMTSAAQQALRRTMELHSATTRFCLACNNSTKIIEAIQSRAAILRYSRLTNEQVLECLLRVCSGEGISYTEGGLEAILFTAEGDLRQALNSLQAANSLVGGSAGAGGGDDGGNMITPEIVYKVCDTPHPKTCQEILQACSRGDARSAVSTLRELAARGYSASDLIGTLFKVTKSSDAIPEALKLEYLREIGFVQLRVVDGVGSTLQLLGLVSRLSQKCQQ
jgi:replication factor C subunit 2/4